MRARTRCCALLKALCHECSWRHQAMLPIKEAAAGCTLDIVDALISNQLGEFQSGNFDKKKNPQRRESIIISDWRSTRLQTMCTIIRLSAPPFVVFHSSDGVFFELWWIDAYVGCSSAFFHVNGNERWCLATMHTSRRTLRSVVVETPMKTTKTKWIVRAGTEGHKQRLHHYLRLMQSHVQRNNRNDF